MTTNATDLIRAIQTAHSQAAPTDPYARELCVLLLAKLSTTMGFELGLELTTVASDADRAVSGASGKILLRGSAAPLPLELTVRISVDMSREEPSVLAFVFLSADGRNVAPREKDFVWYELQLGVPHEPWLCRGWDKDEYDEFIPADE